PGHPGRHLLVRDAFRPGAAAVHRGGLDAAGARRGVPEQRRRRKGAGAAAREPGHRIARLVAVRPPVRPGPARGRRTGGAMILPALVATLAAATPPSCSPLLPAAIGSSAEDL